MFDFRDLRTLSAISDEGSLEAAARRLRVTASAVSQRLARMEERIGQLLVIREQPTRLTGAGETLLRTARQMEFVMEDARTQLGRTADGGVLPVGVHQSSLASWFIGALVRFQRETGRTLEVIAADHTRTRALLRAGVVAAAVSSDPTAVSGCDVESIGRLRYLAVAAPGAEMEETEICFDREDTPTTAVLANRTPYPMTVRRCFVAGVHEMRAAALAGAGWAVLPEPLVARDLKEGHLRQLPPDPAYEIHLFLHSWRGGVGDMDVLRRAVRSAFLQATL